jgi:hypothetical protein
MQKTILLVIFYLFMSPEFVYSQGVLPEEFEEGIFTLRYQYFKNDISVNIRNDSIYIPLLEVFQFLKVYYDLKENNGKIFGYVVDQKHEYEINLNEESFFNVDNILVKYNKNQFYRTQTEIYFTPYLISKLLSCEVNIYKNNLSIRIESRNDFPVLIEEKRYNKYANLNSNNSSDDKLLPLIYDKDFRVLDGGMLSYYLNGTQNKNSQSMNYATNVGVQLMGGEFNYNASGGYIFSNKMPTYDHKFRWKYSFEENDYISNIAVGDLSNTSVRTSSMVSGSVSSKPLSGIQISNENTVMPTVFNNFVIDGMAGPGWQVELYLNDQLSNVALANNLGYYLFNLPVNYGNTNVELKFYGPNGEFMNKKQVITVPGEFIIPGKIKYNINFGQILDEKLYAASGNLSFGLTNWLSNSIQLQKVEKSREMNIINSTSLRVYGGILLNGVYSPKNYAKGGLRISTENWGTYDFILSKSLISIDTALTSNQFSANMNSMEFSVGLPRLFSLPFTLTLRGNKSFNDKYSTTNINSSFSLYVNKFSLSTSYSMIFNEYKLTAQNNLTQNLSPSLSFNWYDKPGFLSFLQKTTFAVGGNYSIDRKKIPNINYSIQQQISKDINLNISYSKSYESHFSTFNISLMTNFPSFLMNSSMQGSNTSDNNYTENISGGIGLNPHDLKCYFGNQGFGGNANGAAVVRFFIDRNNDGVYNKGEEEIPEVQFTIPNATFEKEESGEQRVYNLIPAVRYNLFVKKGSIRNPFVVPKYEEFSFIADPYSFKVIDVPCYMTGSIEGNAYKIIGDKKVEQSGIRVHLINLDGRETQTINLFSDGSFYKLGIVPGKYKIYIDSMQLRLINCTSKPEFINFEVKSTSEGDQVSGLNFELIPKPNEEIPENSPKRIIDKNLKNQNVQATDSVKNTSDKPVTHDTNKVNTTKNRLMDSSKINMKEHISTNINNSVMTVLTGRVAVFDFEKSDKKSLVEKKIILSCTMKLTDGKNTLYSNCDQSGAFVFNNLSSGKWTLSLYKGGLPENHILEKMFQTIEIKNGEKKEILYRILPLMKK